MTVLANVATAADTAANLFAESPSRKIVVLVSKQTDDLSATNDHDGFMHKPSLNRFSRNVVFDNRYFVDWLSEWKVSHVNFV